ncbi:MAG: sigma-E factor regulatory protein RseB domain-containing protein [Fimbriimonas sp.]
MIRLAIAVLLLACSQGSLAQAVATGADDVPGPLRRAIQNSEKARYAGTRMVEFRRGPRTMKHEEYVVRDRTRSRTEFSEGSPMFGQIIVENGDERRHFFPDRNEIHVTPARREESIRRLTKMLQRGKGVRFEEGAGERVAGRPTRQWVVSDEFGNVMQRLFVENSRGFLIKRQIYDRVGTLVGSFSFKEIDFNPKIDDNSFTIVRKGAKIVTLDDELRQAVETGGFVHRTLAPSSGFRLDDVRSMVFGKSPVLMLSYSGPEGRVSLHQTTGDISPKVLERFANDEVQFVTWKSEGRNWLLLGELSQERLKKLSRMVINPNE